MGTGMMQVDKVEGVSLEEKKNFRGDTVRRKKRSTMPEEAGTGPTISCRPLAEWAFSQQRRTPRQQDAVVDDSIESGLDGRVWTTVAGSLLLRIYWPTNVHWGHVATWMDK
jgi:hypothetical protein